ncbi:MAG TPA: hypothetical protein QGF02_03920 [Candidatus Babeliales bacterium]|nr:hypothetical protein [Candidatus Babeliales bacterium]
MKIIRNIMMIALLCAFTFSVTAKPSKQQEKLNTCLKLDQGGSVNPNNTVFLIDFHNVFAFTDWGAAWNSLWYNPGKFSKIFRIAKYYAQKPFHTKSVQGFSLLQYLNAGYEDTTYQAANLLLVNSFKMDTPAVTLLKKIKEDGYKLILFSNTPETSIEWQVRAHPEVFNLFDAKWYRRIANNNITKKHAESFEQVKVLSQETLGHQPEHYIFIDDTKGNITRAARADICGILFTSVNQTDEILTNLGILTK